MTTNTGTIKNTNLTLAGAAWLVGASFHGPKGQGFDSQSGHKPKFDPWVQFLVGVHTRKQLINVSLCLCLSLAVCVSLSVCLSLCLSVWKQWTTMSLDEVKKKHYPHLTPIPVPKPLGFATGVCYSDFQWRATGILKTCSTWRLSRGADLFSLRWSDKKRQQPTQQPSGVNESKLYSFFLSYWQKIQNIFGVPQNFSTYLFLWSLKSSPSWL